MSAFRTVHELETSSLPAREHESPLISQQVCAETNGISLTTQCEVARSRPATVGVEECRYRAAERVRYTRFCEGSAGRSKSRKSAHPVAFLDQSIRV